MAEHQDDFEALDDIDNLDQFKQEHNVSGTGTLSREETKNLDLILDIPLTVTVELGRSKMLINDLLQLGFAFPKLLCSSSGFAHLSSPQ